MCIIKYSNRVPYTYLTCINWYSLKDYNEDWIESGYPFITMLVALISLVTLLCNLEHLKPRYFQAYDGMSISNVTDILT